MRNFCNLIGLEQWYYTGSHFTLPKWGLHLSSSSILSHTWFQMRKNLPKSKLWRKITKVLSLLFAVFFNSLFALSTYPPNLDFFPAWSVNLIYGKSFASLMFRQFRLLRAAMRTILHMLKARAPQELARRVAMSETGNLCSQGRYFKHSQ